VSGRLLGVGVGPGDPDQLTLKALAALRGADRVFVPATESSAGEQGRAERIVAAHLPTASLTRLAFSMRDRTRRPRRWDEAAAAIADVVGAGGTAAFATIGDPNVYSTFTYVAATVRRLVPEVELETIPGITAMQDLAARAGVVLSEGSEPLTLLPFSAAGQEALAEALDGEGTVVIYKGGARLAGLLDAIRAAGRLDVAVCGQDVGLGDERIGAAGSFDGTAGYMSTIVVPARRTAGRGEKL
jgi:precorrin-2/cobalt-factor-2 C20-methyltransferase